MEIRKFNKEDIPRIIDLLVSNFDAFDKEDTLEKFTYKHFENPFGESVIYIAIIDNEIAGMRSFMQWKWQKNNQKFNSYRAVDAVTHHNHLRKGIFTTLTKACLDDIEKNKGLLFNTPNHKSLKGNLKLGWQEIGKISFIAHPCIYELSPNHSNEFSPNQNLWCDSLFEQANVKKIAENRLFTPVNKEYLEWRYLKNPFVKYNCIYNSDYFVACYVKKHSKFNELRISEIIYSDKNAFSQIKKFIKSLAQKNKCRVITTAQERLSLLSKKLNIGPIMVCNNLTHKLDNEYVLDLKNWNYELGDLELF
ncbi:GNAT family N-acetyltransferase [Ornithobacterium rhinotracheale]|uniref:GNAT family N-acetyltransferase n=1 Tax=Ornithobacterium rhinotracheale TaxID=28251 RepID=UPI004035E5A4